jgi:hypothetical protein
MFILGLLSFLQTVFIPGFIVIKYLGINFIADAGNGKKGKIRQLVYSFGLSLLINYLLVFVFTAVGIYKPFALYILLCIEGGLLIYYWAAGCKPRDCRYINLDVSRWFTSLKCFFASHSLTYNFLFLFSVGVMLWYVFLFFYFLGGVFEQWDPVTGWNRFALDWANNQWPANTWRYPQLIPANWSISYVMMQNTDVQCFPKAIMPLFSIAVLLLFLDLALSKKKAVYLLGLVGYGILLGYLYEPSYIVSGYVDIAISFFAFLSFHALYSYRCKDGSYPLQSIWLAIIFASTAAITKQSGLFILAVILVWGFKNIFKNKKLLSVKKITGMILLILLTIAIITGTWYILKEIHISKGQDRSEINLVRNAHQTTSYTKRFTQGVNQLLTHRHPKLKFLVLLGALLVLLGLFHRQSRGVTLFIVVPYTLIWGFFFSYDFRNLMPAIPFMGFSAAFGADFFKKKLLNFEKYHPFKIPIILIIILVVLGLVVVNLTVLKQDNLIRNQIHKKMKMGDAQLNRLLYYHHKKEGLTGKIATNYQYLKYLPGLEHFYWYKAGRIGMPFLEYLETEEGKEIHYLLMPKILKSEKEVYRYVHRKIKTGEYRLVFIWRGYQFIKVKKPST